MRSTCFFLTGTKDLNEQHHIRELKETAEGTYQCKINKYFLFFWKIESTKHPQLFVLIS